MTASLILNIVGIVAFSISLLLMILFVKVSVSSKQYFNAFIGVSNTIFFTIVLSILFIVLFSSVY